MDLSQRIEDFLHEISLGELVSRAEIQAISQKQGKLSSKSLGETMTLIGRA